MHATYFDRLAAETQTRVWVNNPTRDEMGLAIATGAVGCTTNPAYGGGLLRRASDEIRPYVVEAARQTDNDDDAVELVQKRLVSDMLPHFRPLFDSSEGQLGFVSLQGAPDKDSEGSVIAMDARIARALGPNCIPKLPATKPGLEAFEELVAEGHPTITTEVFSLAQIIETCERYQRVTSATGLRPVFIMAPITGIFGDHLRAVAAEEGISLTGGTIELAGIAFARAAARLVAKRDYPVTLLFGGARTGIDLTGLVGSRHQATINWSTFAEVIAADPVLRPTISDEVPEETLAALLRHFEDFRRAMSEDGVTLEEFEWFGPVQYFRANFVAGWAAVRDAVRAERTSLSWSRAS